MGFCRVGERFSLNSQLTRLLGKGKLLASQGSSSPMPASCKHPRVRVVAREEDVEFVECQICGEVFDAAEFKDILNEVESGGDGPMQGDEA